MSRERSVQQDKELCELKVALIALQDKIETEKETRLALDNLCVQTARDLRMTDHAASAQTLQKCILAKINLIEWGL